MNLENMFSKINNITFVSSESCNLQCKYCEIAKNSTISHKEENKKINQALQSGSFLTNFKKFFYDYNINPNQITAIDLWGQEPTINLEYFNTQLNDILIQFPNCEIIFFSTNGIAFPEKIINCIKIINNFLIEENNSDRKIQLKIQFSFDGLEENINARGINIEVIIRNIKTIIEYFNSYKLCPKMSVFFQFHAVLTLEMMKKELAKEDITQHWIDLDNIIDNLYCLNKNKNIIIGNHVYSAFQSPVNATSEEGKIAAEYIKRCSLIDYKFFKKNAFAQTAFLWFFKKQQAEKIDANIFDLYNYGKNLIDDNINIFHFLGCNIGIYNIKMRYDGTLIYCQNTIFNLSEEDLKNKIGSEYDLQRLQLKKNFYPNIITDKKEDILNFINRFDDTHFYYQFAFTQMVNQMYLLIKNKQVDESYENNPEKIFRHIFYILNITSCWYNNCIQTGSLYTNTFGILRFYCNGLLDIIEDISK